MGGSGLTWAIFDGFEAPIRKLTWSPLTDLIELGQAHAHRQCAELPDLLAEWNRQLAYLDGDPSHLDWQAFRPLRTAREEHWSDWLHHFLSTSGTGHLAHQLFTHSGFEGTKECMSPTVTREEVSEDRRADLVIEWNKSKYSQLEVKVGDLNFEKTYDTALRLQQKYPGPARWTHYLLVPREDEGQWHPVDDPALPTVHIVTWDDVAIALRRSLRLRLESHHWLAWAYGFCGLIEQKLLGLPRTAASLVSVSDMARRVRQISIMKRGLEDA